MFDPKMSSDFAFNRPVEQPNFLGTVVNLAQGLGFGQTPKQPSQTDVKANARLNYFRELDKGQQLISQGKTSQGRQTIMSAYRGWTSQYGAGTDEEVDTSFTMATGVSPNVSQYGRVSDIAKIMGTPDFAINVEMISASNPSAPPEQIEAEALRVTQNKMANDAKLANYAQMKAVSWATVERDYQEGVNLLYDGIQSMIKSVQADDVITPDEAKAVRDWYKANRSKFKAPPGVDDKDWKSFEDVRLKQVDEIVNVAIGAASTGSMTNDLNRSLSQIIDKAIVQGKLPPALRIQLAPDSKGEYGNALEILGRLSSEQAFGSRWTESIDTALSMSYEELLDWVTVFEQKGPEFVDKIDTSAFRSMDSKTKINSLEQDRLLMGNSDLGKASIGVINTVEKVASLEGTALTPTLLSNIFNNTFYQTIENIFKANPAVGEAIVNRTQAALASQEAAIMLATDSVARSYGLRLQKTAKGTYDFLPDEKLMPKGVLEDLDRYFGGDWAKAIAAGGKTMDTDDAKISGIPFTTNVAFVVNGINQLRPNIEKFSKVMKSRERLDSMLPKVEGGEGDDKVKGSAGSDTFQLKIPKNSKADYITNGLIRRGMPQHIAEGFLVNFHDESSLNSSAVGDNGAAFGLAQWNGPRKRALEAYAASVGKPASDIDTQLDFLMVELGSNESNAWSKIQQAGNASEAAIAILNHFERPAEVNRAKREARYGGGVSFAFDKEEYAPTVGEAMPSGAGSIFQQTTSPEPQEPRTAAVERMATPDVERVATGLPEASPEARERALEILKTKPMDPEVKALIEALIGVQNV